jgi:hypothetical protein
VFRYATPISWCSPWAFHTPVKVHSATSDWTYNHFNSGLVTCLGDPTWGKARTAVKNNVDQKFWIFVVSLTIISLLILWVSLQKPL